MHTLDYIYDLSSGCLVYTTWFPIPCKQGCTNKKQSCTHGLYIFQIVSKNCIAHSFLPQVQWWFVNPDTFVPIWYFRINEFSGLPNRPSDQKRKSVPALFVRISEISGLSEPGLTNHHCIQSYYDKAIHSILRWLASWLFQDVERPFTLMIGWL